MAGTSELLRGSPVSPGVVVGRAWLYKPQANTVLECHCEPGAEQEAAVAFGRAVKTAEEELLNLISKCAQSSPQQAEIMAAHIEILNDEEIIAEVYEKIEEEKKCPDWAVKIVFDEFIELLGGSPDPIIAARVADLADVRNRLVRILHGVETAIQQPEGKVIVVAHDLLPSDTSRLDMDRVLGIITETGSTTSHTAIIARSCGIPAVLGAIGAMDVIADGCVVAMDAVEGVVSINPSAEILGEFAERREAYELRRKEAESYKGRPAETEDGTRIEVGLNIGNADFNPEGCDFVGLFRTEFLYMDSDHAPTEEEQFDAYVQVLKRAQGRPVTLRTLDIGGDKSLDYIQLPEEDNPFLGKRALRFCIANPELFMTQLRAVLRASAYGKLQIMFPMVGSIEDIRTAKSYVDEAKAQLKREGYCFDENIKVGIMIEIPSIAAIADLAAEECDFASVGTNDLCQYLCASDRMNPEVSEYSQPLSSAMLRTLRTVFREFTVKGKEVSVCGEMAGDSKAAVAMLGLGLRKLSMSRSCIPEIKRVINMITVPDAEDLSERLCRMKTQSEIVCALNDFIEHLESK